MGFAASQARLMSLIARRQDLELEAQFISQHRMHLANKVSGLFSLQASLDPESQASRILEARIRALQAADKQLEMNLNRIKAQRDAVSQEINAARSVADQNVKDSFGLLARR